MANVQRTLDEYLRVSGAWLIDAVLVYDLGESARKAMDPGFRHSRPTGFSEKPQFSSDSGCERLAKVMPVRVYSSKEAIQAREMVHGKDPPKDEKGRIWARGAGPGLRVAQIVARAGMISQFELWKQYARARRFPVAVREARADARIPLQPREAVIDLINKRNLLTHEPDVLNDPTMSDLLLYTAQLRGLAKWIELSWRP